MATVALGSRAASAHGSVDDPGHERIESGAAEKDDGVERAKPAEEEEGKPFSLGLDLVQGFGKVDVLTRDLPGTLGTQPVHSIDSTAVSTESFLAGAGYEISRRTGFGLRLPFTFAAFSGRYSGSGTALGNLELEGEHKLIARRSLALVAALGVALPTAGGVELPSQQELAQDPTAPRDLTAATRFSTNHAAASARAFEENALFESKRFGLIPKLTLEVKSGKLTFEPYVKLENLMSTVTTAKDAYLGELVFGGRVDYRVSPLVDAALRAWGNVPIAGGDALAIAAVEPQARLHVASVTPYAGLLLPVAGPLADPYFVGIRVGASGRF